MLCSNVRRIRLVSHTKKTIELFELRAHLIAAHIEQLFAPQLTKEFDHLLHVWSRLEEFRAHELDDLRSICIGQVPGQFRYMRHDRIVLEHV